MTDDDSMVDSMVVVDDASIASDTSHYSDIPVSPISCSSSDDDNEQLYLIQIHMYMWIIPIILAMK